MVPWCCAVLLFVRCCWLCHDGVVPCCLCRALFVCSEFCLVCRWQSLSLERDLAKLGVQVALFK